MKYLIKGSDITGADWSRVLLSDNKVFLKDFSPYKKIDLGLPSGTLWADRNIGATDIYDGGKLFQWGDPTPYDIPEHTNGTINEGQKMFISSDYKWLESGTSTMIKYNYTDGKTTLDPEDDAAHVNMGSDWRMPTKDDINELLQNTTQELYVKLSDDSVPVKVAEGTYNENQGYVSWTYIDGHTSGEASEKLTYMKLLSKSNGNFLVVPSSVYAGTGDVDPVGRWSNFWLSSLGPQNARFAWYGKFGNGGYGAFPDSLRCIGIGVRGVVGQ